MTDRCKSERNCKKLRYLERLARDFKEKSPRVYASLVESHDFLTSNFCYVENHINCPYHQKQSPEETPSTEWPKVEIK